MQINDVVHDDATLIGRAAWNDLEIYAQAHRRRRDFRGGDDRLSVTSAFHVFYAGQRRDVLLREGEEFRILDRPIVMDMADVELPTPGLFL